MNIKSKKISSNQIELEIEIPASQMDNYFQLAVSELSKDMKISGFRPGKIPIEIVEREKGSQELYNQAANLAVKKTLPSAILENEVELVGQPDIVVTQIARGNSMKYKAKIWVIPEVNLANYKGLKIKKKKIKIENKEIDEALKYLQKSRAKLITVNRPAKKGDKVEIDFITRGSGVKIEGGESKNHPLIIGEGRFIPGFEKELEGMKSGEEKSFSCIVPKDWPQKKIANRTLDFQIKINLVQKMEIPELSDEFAKSLGKFESLEALKKSIKDGIGQEKKLKEKSRIRMELIEKIACASQMDISQILIDNELNKMIEELRQNVLSMGLDFDKYLKQIKKTIDDLKKEWKSRAEKRVKTSLVLREIAKKEKIEISEDEIIQKINETLQHYPNAEEAKKSIDPAALKEYTKEVLRNEKVFELIEKEAKL